MVNAGASLLFLGFHCVYMPEPEDSGIPILQAGKVIGAYVFDSFKYSRAFGISKIAFYHVFSASDMLHKS